MSFLLFVLTVTFEFFGVYLKHSTFEHVKVL